MADHHEALEEFRQAHYQNYPRLNRLWLHQLRIGLHLGVAACRGVLVVLTVAIRQARAEDDGGYPGDAGSASQHVRSSIGLPAAAELTVSQVPVTARRSPMRCCAAQTSRSGVAARGIVPRTSGPGTLRRTHAVRTAIRI